MSKTARTPRVIIMRHGETEWSKSGQYTSRTDLPLTENGRKLVAATGQAMVGDNRLIHPDHLEKIFVSPRLRAHQTLDILFQDHKEELAKIPVEVAEDVREWEYGDYEGMITKDIRELRKSRGLDTERPWQIWRDGCENGESPEQITERLDRLIDKIVAIHHKAVVENRYSEVLVVAHGHSLRAFVLRWVNRKVEENPSIILEAGGVGVLSYEHHNCDERALCLGGGFIIPKEE
ncbi:sedoheptulose 1,7-bisphosphatase [Trichomonascus vanleenenianus]|uniref:sedoheptulose-bisphosphatase n=1 Tax=Trichomonascus vanleenenianus TaxID=2268995 RepID=UPI003ECA3101